MGTRESQVLSRLLAWLREGCGSPSPVHLTAVTERKRPKLVDCAQITKALSAKPRSRTSSRQRDIMGLYGVEC